MERDGIAVVGSVEWFEVAEDKEAIEDRKGVDVGLLVALLPYRIILKLMKIWRIEFLLYFCSTYTRTLNRLWIE